MKSAIRQVVCGRFVRCLVVMLLTAGAMSVAAPCSLAVVHSVTVDGGDAIFIAGRTDLVIPPAASPWTGPGDYLIRHGGATPEEIQETLPPSIPVAAGDVIRVLEGPISPVEFTEEEDPAKRHLWIRIRDSINEVLDSTTLLDLITFEENGNNDYYMFYL